MMSPAAYTPILASMTKKLIQLIAMPILAPSEAIPLKMEMSASIAVKISVMTKISFAVLCSSLSLVLTMA